MLGSYFRNALDISSVEILEECFWTQNPLRLYLDPVDVIWIVFSHGYLPQFCAVCTFMTEQCCLVLEYLWSRPLLPHVTKKLIMLPCKAGT